MIQKRLNALRDEFDARIGQLEVRLIEARTVADTHAAEAARARSDAESLAATVDRQQRRLAVVEGWVAAHAANLGEHDSMKKDIVRLGNLIRSCQVQIESETENLRRTDLALLERIEAARPAASLSEAP